MRAAIRLIGNLAPGATGKVDGDGKRHCCDDRRRSVKAVLTYEDDAGNQTRQEIDMQLYVSEPMIDDGSDMMIPEEEPQKTSNIGMIIGIIAAVAAGIVVVVVVVKLRKKKKAGKASAGGLARLKSEG